MIDRLCLVNTNYGDNHLKSLDQTNGERFSYSAIMPQLGLASLFAYLGMNSPDVKAYLVDAVLKNLSPEETAEIALKGNPGAIGASATYNNLNETLGILSRAKRDNPKVITILGGPGARSLFDLTGGKSVDCLDYCVIGDGEVVLGNILKDGSIPKETKYLQGFVKDLDTLPSPYDIDPETCKPFLDCFKVKGYFEANRNRPYSGEPPNNKVLTDYSSKGCSNNCTYCSTKTIWRGRNPNRIREDLDAIKTYYGKDCKIFITDDNPTSGPEEWLVETYKAIGMSGLPWYTQIRADDFTKKCDGKLPKLMADCGCMSVYIGAESGSQKFLDIFNKGMTAKDTLNAIKSCTDAGIKTNLFLVYNFPEESEKELGETLDLVRKAKSIGGLESVIAFEYFPIPGSRAFRDGHHKGMLSEEAKSLFRSQLLKICDNYTAAIFETYK
jgi:anaerobic magnesium-protoporphyrin IX monomethyl ester cyclase